MTANHNPSAITTASKKPTQTKSTKATKAKAPPVKAVKEPSAYSAELMRAKYDKRSVTEMPVVPIKRSRGRIKGTQLKKDESLAQKLHKHNHKLKLINPTLEANLRLESLKTLHPDAVEIIPSLNRRGPRPKTYSKRQAETIEDLVNNPCEFFHPEQPVGTRNYWEIQVSKIGEGQLLGKEAVLIFPELLQDKSYKSLLNRPNLRKELLQAFKDYQKVRLLQTEFIKEISSPDFIQTYGTAKRSHAYLLGLANKLNQLADAESFKALSAFMLKADTSPNNFNTAKSTKDDDKLEQEQQELEKELARQISKQGQFGSLKGKAARVMSEFLDLRPELQMILLDPVLHERTRDALLKFYKVNNPTDLLSWFIERNNVPMLLPPLANDRVSRTYEIYDQVFLAKSQADLAAKLSPEEKLRQQQVAKQRKLAQQRAGQRATTAESQAVEQTTPDQATAEEANNINPGKCRVPKRVVCFDPTHFRTTLPIVEAQNSALPVTSRQAGRHDVEFAVSVTAGVAICPFTKLPLGISIGSGAINHSILMSRMLGDLVKRGYDSFCMLGDRGTESQQTYINVHTLKQFYIQNSSCRITLLKQIRQEAVLAFTEKPYKYYSRGGNLVYVKQVTLGQLLNLEINDEMQYFRCSRASAREIDAYLLELMSDTLGTEGAEYKALMNLDADVAAKLGQDIDQADLNNLVVSEEDLVDTADASEQAGSTADQDQKELEERILEELNKLTNVPTVFNYLGAICYRKTINKRNSYTLALPPEVLKETVYVVVTQNPEIREAVLTKIRKRELKKEQNLNKNAQLKKEGKSITSNVREPTKAELESGKYISVGDRFYVNIEALAKQSYKTARVLVTNLPYPEICTPGQLESDKYYGEAINANYKNRWVNEICNLGAKTGMQASTSVNARSVEELYYKIFLRITSSCLDMHVKHQIDQNLETGEKIPTDLNKREKVLKQPAKQRIVKTGESLYSGKELPHTKALARMLGYPFLTPMLLTYEKKKFWGDGYGETFVA